MFMSHYATEVCKCPGKVQQFDVVLANPPYSISTWNREKFEHDKYGRCFLGVPPQGYADYAFIQHILASMDETNGRCAILLPHGILNRISETKIREELIKADLVDTIISIGKNLFYNSPMEACVVICQKKKPENRKGKILMIDARDLVTRDSTMSYLTSEHIREISQLYTNYVIIEGRTNIAKATDLLGNKDCSMNVSLYVKRRYSSDALPIEQAIQAWELCSANTNTEVSSLIEML